MPKVDSISMFDRSKHFVQYRYKQDGDATRGRAKIRSIRRIEMSRYFDTPKKLDTVSNSTNSAGSSDTLLFILVAEGFRRWVLCGLPRRFFFVGGPLLS